MTTDGRSRFRRNKIAHREIAQKYSVLKLRLASMHQKDRVAYTRDKTQFIARVTEARRARDTI